MRFSHFPRSLATTSGINCFLFLRVLRCFTSPRSPPHPIYSGTGNTTSLVLGFPIRKSSDQRSVDSSPRHIAASHVLHRLSMPRHPPCALRHLQTLQKPKNKIAQKRTRYRERQRICFDARNHYPILKHHTPPPRWRDNTWTNSSVASGPNSVSGLLVVVHPAPVHYRQEPLTARTPPIGVLFVVLLRKEVIQPHLPVRLPCYDFVPIADPTFDSSLPKG